MAKLGADQRAGYQELGVVEGYDKWASTYDQEPNSLIALEERVTLDMIGNVQGQRVLDLGCGSGRYCALLAQRGAGVVGIDPSERMLELARRKITPGSQFELRQGMADKVSFPSGHFDLIISALTLGHLPDLEPTLREAARLLKEGGWLVISDLHPYWPVSGHDYTEFFDAGGQEYRIRLYPHLLEEYWHLGKKFGLHFEDVREPVIGSRLIESFPSLKDHEGLPLAIVLKLRRGGFSTDDRPARERPSLTVDVVVIGWRGGRPQVLLVRRRNPPFEGCWALPGGFVQPHEPLEAAARRELEEETGAEVRDLEQLRAFGDPGRDPRGWTVSVAYLALLDKGDAMSLPLRAGSDAASVGWFDLDGLPPLAFDHAEILAYAERRLAERGTSSKAVGGPGTR